MYGQRIVDARAAVERFLFDLLQKEDEFFVLAFNHYPHILTRWTSTPRISGWRLPISNRRAGPPSMTRWSDALPMIGRRTRERAALVVISDGADTASDITVVGRAHVTLADRSVRLCDRDRLAEASGHQHTGQCRGARRDYQSERRPDRSRAGHGRLAGGHGANCRGAQQPIRDGLRHPRTRPTASITASASASPGPATKCGRGTATSERRQTRQSAAVTARICQDHFREPSDSNVQRRTVSPCRPDITPTGSGPASAAARTPSG